MEFTDQEIECLIAGVGQPGAKDAAWSKPDNKMAIERLCETGHIVTGNLPYADGHVERIPLNLSRLGMQQARRLLDEASG
jgi:hypothetical protein